MSFVSKGEKKMHNKVKGASMGNADRSLPSDKFGKKGQPKNHNMAPGSKDKASEPVSEDGMEESTSDASKTVKSTYDPASGKRAGSVADLRNAQKLINERSEAGEASPTGSEGGQQDKHGSSKNASGYMKAGMSKMDKMSKEKPRGESDQMAGSSDMEDPMDEDEEDSGQAEEGMTPKGKSRKKMTSLKQIKDKIAGL